MNQRIVTVGVVIVVVVSTVGYVISLWPQLTWQMRLVLAASQDLVIEREMTELKKQLEEFYNEHSYYPERFEAGRYQYVVVSRDGGHTTGWYLRAPRYSATAEKSDYDGQKGRGFDYRIIKDGESFYYDICGGTVACTTSDHATH